MSRKNRHRQASRRRKQPQLTQGEMERAEYQPVVPVTSNIGEEPEPEITDPVEPAEPEVTEEPEPEPEEPEIPLSPRELIANAYAERNYGKSEEPEEPEEEPEELEEEEEPEPTELDEEPEPEPTDQYVQVTVDGRSFLAERDKVEAAGGVELYQRLVSVNNKFQELSHHKTQLENWQKNLEERERLLKEQSPPKMTTQVEQTPAQPNGDDSEQLLMGIRKFRENITDGRDDDADQELLRLILAARQPGQVQQPAQAQEAQPVDIDAITQQAAQIVKQETQQEIDKRITNEFLDGHPELLKDKRLFRAVDGETDVVAAEKPHLDLKGIYEESFKRVMEWRGGNGAASPKRQQKIEQKRTAAPTSRAGKTQAAPPPKRQTRKEYVQELRKQRGLE